MPHIPEKFRPEVAAAVPKLAPSWRRWYGQSRWKKLREWQLSRSPLCVDCLKAERTTGATEVDHIVPHRGDPLLFFDPLNLQSLCTPHHSEKTQRGE